MSKRKGLRGPVFWVPVVLIGIASAVIWVLTRPAAVMDWLRFGPAPEPPVTDLSGTRDDERDDAPGTGTE